MHRTIISGMNLYIPKVRMRRQQYILVGSLLNYDIYLSVLALYAKGFSNTLLPTNNKNCPS